MRHFTRFVLGCSAYNHAARRSLMDSSAVRLGISQIQDVPTSTDRKPRGFHRGPGKRLTSPSETERYQFIKRWDLCMQEMWDDLEPFNGLPKPKAQLGNEAAELIWPYVLLLERVVKVHPFTKSIYVYYSQRQSTPTGKASAAAARAFSHEYLVPITFHNSQVYTETELMMEYNETPWYVVHCLDGRQRVRPIVINDPDLGRTAAVSEVLKDVVKTCEELGSSVSNPKEVTRALNERPLQNQYLRINYQWFGDTPEERMSHLVHWDFDPASVEPKLRSRKRHVMDWMNFDGNLPTHNSVRVNVHRESARMRRPNISAGPKTFFNSSGARANARSSRFGGMAK